MAPVSQTANSVLMRAIFQMGIPVSERTCPLEHPGAAHLVHHPRQQAWGTSPQEEVDFSGGHESRERRARRDKARRRRGVVYDEPLKLDALRSTALYPVPFEQTRGPVCPEAKLRKLVRNMIYDGIVANLLSIDMEEVHKALFKQFGKKKEKPPN